MSLWFVAPGAEAWTRLQAALSSMPGAVVAFSGGVDSAVLLAAAREVLGAERVLAVIAVSPSLAREELASARVQAAQIGVELIELETRELDDPRYRANAGDRCFWCKEALFTTASPLAEARGWDLCYGENADDAGEHRPGARSAAARGVRAPLREAGWGKAEVRSFARLRGLSSAEKPAAPCLASRLPVGVPVSRTALDQLEKLEESVRGRGFRIVRVRHFAADRAVLEIGAEELERAQAILSLLRADAEILGYAHLDLRAYRSGAVAGPALQV